MHSNDSDRPQVTLYGNDQGANNVLDCVQSAVAGEYSIHRIPGLNVVVPQEEIKRARSSVAVVLGLSTSRPEARVARELLEKNPALRGRLVFVEDFPGTAGVNLHLMADIVPAATACTIRSGGEEALRQFGYHGVQTVGAPDHWARILDNMRFGMDVRKSGALQKRRRGTDERVAVAPADPVVYVPGFYAPETERRLLSHLLNTPGEPVIHFRAHPGEKNRPELQEGIAVRDALLPGSWEIANDDITQAGRDADGRLAGTADAIVIHPGATIAQLTATFDKRVISIMELVAPQEWASRYDYRLAGQNTHLVDRIDQCRNALFALLRDGSSEQKALAAKQQQSRIPFDPHAPMSFGKNVFDVVQRVARA